MGAGSRWRPVVWGIGAWVGNWVRRCRSGVVNGGLALLKVLDFGFQGGNDGFKLVFSNCLGGDDRVGG